MTNQTSNEQLLTEWHRWLNERGPDDCNTYAAFCAGFAAAQRRAGETGCEWRCFHCDEVFTDREKAAEHFGKYQMLEPACTIDIAEYRRMEEANGRHCAEDTDLHREIHRMSADHATALRREEEKGYARGLRDAGFTGETTTDPNALLVRLVLDMERIGTETNGLSLAREHLFRTGHLPVKSKAPPVHADPTGTTREPPHCPTCACGAPETAAELLLHKPSCISMYASPETGRYACDCGAVKST